MRKMLSNVLTHYHGWIYLAFCFLYYAAISLLSAIGVIPREAYDTYEILHYSLILVMALCLGLEIFTLDKYAKRHYPEEWREYNGLGLIKPMTRFSCIFFTEIEPDKVLLAIKRNIRVALLLLVIITVFGGVFLKVAHSLAGTFL